MPQQWRFLFGNKDIANLILPNERSFTVNIAKFGDPQKNVFKYLHIIDTEKNITVVVSENDVVNDLNTAFTDIPCSHILQPLQKLFLTGRGLCFEDPTTLRSLNLCSTLPLSCTKVQTLTLDQFLTVDYIITPIRHATNLMFILTACQQKLSPEGGNLILIVFDERSHETRQCLSKLGMAVKYLQRTSEVHVIIATKHDEPTTVSTKSHDELDTKHDNENDHKLIEQLEILGFKLCPFCGEAQGKHNGCDFVYCGLLQKFQVGYGCGRSFCFRCGLKYCGFHYDPHTGKQLATYKSKHDAVCCKQEKGFIQSEYCPGGHSSHADVRW